jgi:hypothetical protein
MKAIKQLKVYLYKQWQSARRRALAPRGGHLIYIGLQARGGLRRGIGQAPVPSSRKLCRQCIRLCPTPYRQRLCQPAQGGRPPPKRVPE